MILDVKTGPNKHVVPPNKPHTPNKATELSIPNFFVTKFGNKIIWPEKLKTPKQQHTK